jgi:hypothetical protein
VAPWDRASLINPGVTACPSCCTAAAIRSNAPVASGIVGAVEIGADLVDQSHSGVELGGGERGVRVAAEGAVVERRDVRGDQFALAPGQRIGRDEQCVDERLEWAGGLRAVGEHARDSRMSGLVQAEVDVCHGVHAPWYGALRGTIRRSGAGCRLRVWSMGLASMRARLVAEEPFAEGHVRWPIVCGRRSVW